MLNPRLLFTAAVFSAAAILPASAGTVDVYLSAPLTQTATQSGAPDSGGMFSPGYTNALVETFNGATAGSAYTTFTSTTLNGASFTTPGTFAIKPNDQFGGGGQGNYLGVSNTGTTTLQLSAPVGYIGLEWCAVDGNNNLSLYDQNNALIGTFNAATFNNLLKNNTTITAINGTTYNTADYFGQPTGGVASSSRNNDPSEAFAYVNFIAESGTQISKIVLSQGGGAIFESDNYAILSTAPTALGTFVALTSVPEPSTWSLFGLAGSGLALGVFRRRARRA